MKKSIIKSPGGLWYERWDPTVESSLNRILICCIHGSVEYGSYSASDMNAEVSRVAEKMGFAQDSTNGEELPFIHITPLATKGSSIADHSLIAKEIGNVAKSVDADYRFIGGLSLGGQTTAGFLFQAKTSTEISKNAASSYVNADVFDGFFMLAGQQPTPTDPCAFPNKHVFMAHAVGDTSIKIDQSFTMMRLLNACTERKQKIYPTYEQKWGSSGAYYTVPAEVPADAINKLIVIQGGGHSTSWTETYNWNGAAGTAGYEFRKWIETIAIPKQQADVPGKIVLRNGQAIAIFEDGTEKILSVQ